MLVWFLVVWGLLATAHGVLLALNFRGYTERVLRLVGKFRRPGPHYNLGSGQWRVDRVGPPFGVGTARLFGVVFAIVGPVVLTNGVIALIKS
jgi:hypothetical protein